MVNVSRRGILLKAGIMLASYLGAEFVGRVEINIHKGGVGSIDVRETYRPSEAETSAATTGA